VLAIRLSGVDEHRQGRRQPAELFRAVGSAHIGERVVDERQLHSSAGDFTDRLLAPGEIAGRRYLMAQMPRDGLVKAAFAFHDGDGEQWTFSTAGSGSFRAILRPRGASGRRGRGPGWLRVDGGVTPGQRIGGPVE